MTSVASAVWLGMVKWSANDEFENVISGRNLSCSVLRYYPSVWPTRIEENRDTCRDIAIPWAEILTIDFRNTKQRCRPSDGYVRPKLLNNDCPTYALGLQNGVHSLGFYTVVCVSVRPSCLVRIVPASSSWGWSPEYYSRLLLIFTYDKDIIKRCSQLHVLKLIALFSAFCRWVFVIVSARCFC